MTQVKSGDTVRIHYTGTLNNGTVFDSSQGRDPLEFTVGSGQIIPGLDKALPGMAVGDTKSVPVPAAEAYGARNDEAVMDVPKSEFPDDIPLKAGTMLEMRSPDGKAVPVQITEVKDDAVTLDANHRLAGEDLNFDIELVSIG